MLVIRAEFKSQRMLSAMWASHTIDAKPDEALGRTGVGWDGDIAGRCSKGALRTGNKYTLFPTPEVTRLESTRQAAHSQKEVFFHPEPH